MRSNLILISGCLLLLIAAAATGQSRAASARADSSVSNAEVKIDNFNFTPPELAVSRGTTVTWENHDDVPHTIVSTDGKGIKSGVLDTDQKFSFTFSKPGTYEYYCSIHPKMTGKVVVK